MQILNLNCMHLCKCNVNFIFKLYLWTYVYIYLAFYNLTPEFALFIWTLVLKSICNNDIWVKYDDNVTNVRKNI